MSRYIDVDNAIAAIRAVPEGNWSGEKYVQEIMKVPTADVAEVVYCNECKYNAKGDNESEFWNICTLRPLLYVPVSDADYCSEGERKES